MFNILLYIVIPFVVILVIVLTIIRFMFVDKDESFIDAIKNRLEQKRAEKAYVKEIHRQARLQALQELQPDMVKHIKEQELKKLTGEDKKEKMQKFANAFSMGGLNTNDKLQGMLGSQNQQNTNPDMFSKQKINSMLGKEPEPRRRSYTRSYTKQKEDETQRIIDLLK